MKNAPSFDCIPNNMLELIAARFRALGEASRLKLVLAVGEGEKNVTELVRGTGLSQANVSKHLKTLTDAAIFFGNIADGPPRNQDGQTLGKIGCDQMAFLRQFDEERAIDNASTTAAKIATLSFVSRAKFMNIGCWKSLHQSFPTGLVFCERIQAAQKSNPKGNQA